MYSIAKRLLLQLESWLEFPSPKARIQSAALVLYLIHRPGQSGLMAPLLGHMSHQPPKFNLFDVVFRNIFVLKYFWGGGGSFARRVYTMVNLFSSTLLQTLLFTKFQFISMSIGCIWYCS